MKNILTIVFLLAGCMAFGQQNEWTSISTDDGVNVSYKVVHCDMSKGYDTDYYILKFENTNDHKVAITWDLKLWYNGVCKTCDDASGEYHRVIELTAGQTDEGSCSDGGNNELYFFKKFDDPNFNGKDEQVTDFELANLRVIDMTPTK